jgi:hypothetical protein
MSTPGSTIIITRTSQYANRLRGIKIFINGKEAGSVGNGKTEEFPVPAGTVELYARIDWCKTKPVTLTLDPGQKVSFELGSPLKGARLFLTLYYAIFKPGDWIYLRRTN